MSHLPPFVLCLAGFTALALSTRRQQRDLLGGSLRPATTYVFRGLGACALLSALGVLVNWHGWSLGLVMFSGHTSMASGIVYCTLIAYARMQQSTPRRHR
jgi:hypothetical protein